MIVDASASSFVRKSMRFALLSDAKRRMPLVSVTSGMFVGEGGRGVGQTQSGPQQFGGWLGRGAASDDRVSPSRGGLAGWLAAFAGWPERKRARDIAARARKTATGVPVGGADGAVGAGRTA